MLRKNAFDLFLVTPNSGPPNIVGLKFSRRVQQTATAKPPLVSKFGVILIGIEHRKDTLIGLFCRCHTPIIER